MGLASGPVLAVSDGAALAGGLAALAALAVLAVVVAPAGRRSGAGGKLSRETVRADRGPLPVTVTGSPPGAGGDGRAVERAARARASPITPAPAPAAPARTGPADAETLGVTRRQFFNRSIVGLAGLSVSGFAASVLAFLWPIPAGGFGAKITVGRLDDILAGVRDTREPYYNAAGRFFVTAYPTAALGKARDAYAGEALDGMAQGVVALYQKCPHLGCRVPWCITSQWFECPCHGSQYNRVGEKKGGPAPRGMDRFPVRVDGGQLVVDTGVVVQGPPVGTDTTGQEAEGPHCVGSGE